MLNDEALRLVAIGDTSAVGSGTDGLIELNGPLGLSRLASTRLDVANPRRLAGIATVGKGTRAEVSWELEPAGTGTRVSLRADVVAADRADRVLLAAGGRIWVRHRFAVVLRRLDAVIAEHGPELSATRLDTVSPRHSRAAPPATAGGWEAAARPAAARG